MDELDFVNHQDQHDTEHDYFEKNEQNHILLENIINLLDETDRLRKDLYDI